MTPTAPEGSMPAMTYGQTMVGASFNPSQNPQVDEVKDLCAKMIDMCKEILDNEPRYTEFNDLSFRGQVCRDAITQLVIAQMMAVKAITFKQ